ncbi:nuclear transport factor 2 family protein [Mesorhizobium sp. YC-39]|uniref:nuclear transport factor 2 family protein n=1 Tax=unclassified Mesorhizobium TaxID=325217 RepID=UPI0021E89E4A|nr:MULTISPECIES: nuclear transport factor 2 family protein [unclassified Mesorhizobium]MCV3208294.1 nuclear transport factor 2 family protein [Mesorhizobium sp. YC-2]MCV3232356.1 nuclear transport factor 2 family protein [Mesorhizobium sp. YC-39]
MEKTLDRRSTAMELLENMFDVEMRFLRSDSDSVDMLAGAFHAEVVVHEPRSLPYAGDWKGLDGIGALFYKMREMWSDVAVECLQAAQNDDMVYMSCTLRLTARANGAIVTQPFAEVLRFKDGRLIEGTPFYHDTAEILTALGSPALAVEAA